MGKLIIKRRPIAMASHKAAVCFLSVIVIVCCLSARHSSSLPRVPASPPLRRQLNSKVQAHIWSRYPSLLNLNRAKAVVSSSSTRTTFGQANNSYVFHSGNNISRISFGTVSNFTEVLSSFSKIPSKIMNTNSSKKNANTTTTTSSPLTTISPLSNGRVTGEPLGCQKTSSCTCEMQDGARLDLTPLANSNRTPRFLDFADNIGLYTYSWNPCDSFDEGVCSDVAVCQSHATNSTTVTYILGYQQTVDFQVSSSHGLMLQYTAKDGLSIAMRTTYVQMRCDPDVEADFTVQGELIPRSGIYYLTLTSRYACLTGGSPNVTSTTPITTSPSAGNVTVPNPTSKPQYSLKTVILLLTFLTLIVGTILVVMLMILVAIIAKRRFSKSTNEKAALGDTSCLDATIGKSL